METVTTKDEKHILSKIITPLLFPIILWVIHTLSVLININLSSYGIYPRHFKGLLGIIVSPLIHADYSHLISNTAPLIVLGLSIFYFYPKVAYKSLFIIYFGTGILVWIFGREAYHIGASGIIYGFISFLFFSGLFRKDNRSIALALVVVFLYGSLIWGVLPGKQNVSWESHLFGAIVGIFLAFIFRKVDPSKRYDWEDEESDIPVKDLEVSYDPEKNKFLDEL
ncbi:MAG: rhomboid family intramembrane serine protease [Ignavibacteriales bacterium]|jgi:membrane associated rhomboid family serine protease|nr:rhomboid family intramembrane serine protease [Ignavibacteriales bacterium]MDD5607378.1 rhomboid family intramembrane serine protease [Ignavibacterium sp.]MDX9710914.1 rhomboid family intramembrane serine protease [Ignavibacteriaceae bacterium]GIK21107.1 MAG: rhomboid family intramembrane serine protease [Ignavibacteriota bacterium]MEB2355532.1 rhomboid family intramembrane serine protease [Ignavibacteriales bacterium]